MKLAIASTVVEAVLAHARAEHPREACGLLTGTSDTIAHAVAAANVATRPEAVFEIDPATLLSTHRDARGAGQAVLGHYHSHPNGRTEPSRTDAARATQDGQIWVIAANDALSAWTMTAEGFVAVELVAA